MKTQENRKPATSGIMDEEFLMLVRKNWKNLPQLFRVRLVKNLYRNVGSIRKTAKLLGLGRSTIFHYLKYYRHSTFPNFSHKEQTSMLKEFLTDICSLLQNADPSIHDAASNHHLSSGDEANLTQCWGGKDE